MYIITSINYGLFKINEGIIENLTFTDVEVTCSSSKSITSFGIIAGENTGTISNCQITYSNNQKTNNSVNGNGKLTVTNLGGMVGNNLGTLNNCSVSGLTIQNINSSNLGGMIGIGNVKKNETGEIELESCLESCSVNGLTINEISSDSSAYLGGMIGNNFGTIGSISETTNIESVNIKEVRLGGTSYIGGGVGKNLGNIYNCDVNNINIDADDSSNTTYANAIAGIVGLNQGNINKISMQQLTIKANNTSIQRVGGIVGFNSESGKVENININSSNLEIYLVKNQADIGMVVGRYEGNTTNNNSYIQNCIVNGTINDYSSDNNNEIRLGGIVGNTYKNYLNIRNCYSNVKMNLNRNKLNTRRNEVQVGGIVGLVTNNAQNTNINVESCAYTNEIFFINNSAYNIGGIIGKVNKLTTRGYETQGTMNLESCYMNGIIPESTNSGAVIGKIEQNNMSTGGTINAGTVDGKVYYNQAYRWLGYTSSIPTGVTLNYNCIPIGSTILDDEIEKNIYGIIKPNSYRYIKIVISKIYKKVDLMQMSEWMFLDSSGNRFNFDNAEISVTPGKEGNPGEKYISLFDGIIRHNEDGSSNKYCVQWSSPIELTITLPKNNRIDIEKYDRYCYYTGSDNSNSEAGCEGRTPISWNIYFSQDGNFEESDKIVEVNDYLEQEEKFNQNYAQIGPFNINIP